MTQILKRNMSLAFVLSLAALAMPAVAQTKAEPNTAEKAWDSTKKGTEKAWDATKDTTKKGWDATKRGTKKAVDATDKGATSAMDSTRRTGEKIDEKLPQTQNNEPLKK